jgi:hypothetical protein
MTLQQFFDLYNGKRVDYDSAFGAQCKDLFSYYNRDIVKNPQYVYGDAYQLYDAAPALFYKKVDIPRKGDIAIWRKDFGGYGHIAIVWGDGLFFSQNYPFGAPCSLVEIPTNKIMGYLKPLTTIDMGLGDKLNGKTIVKQPGGDKALVKESRKYIFDEQTADLSNPIVHSNFVQLSTFVTPADWDSIPTAKYSAADRLRGKVDNS